MSRAAAAGRPRKKNKHIGSSFDSWLREEGIHEEVTAKALKRVAARQEASATARKGPTKSKEAKACKSEALAALHENVSDLHRAGFIDDKTLRKFDAACLAPARKPARTAK